MLEVTPELIARLAREDLEPEFGARALKRHLRRTLEKELIGAILNGQIADGRCVLAANDDEHEIVLSVSEAAIV